MKNRGKSNTGAGCSVVADKNTAIAGGGGVHVRRVLWRHESLFVYQDTTGRYWWADLDQRRRRPAVIIGGKRK